MNSAKIKTFDYLAKFSRVHVKITDRFFNRIKNKILGDFGSLRKYNKALKISYPTLKWEFRQNAYHPFYRILKIIKDIHISKEELYKNILGFYHWGSHRKEHLKIPFELNIDEFFVEGFALYLAEGDTGLSGKTKPRKFRFTNSEIGVINNMIKWITMHFPKNDFYVVVINPKGNKIDIEVIKKSINCDNIKFKEGTYNKVVKYRIFFDQAILIDLILAIEEKIKELCKKDKKLAAAYIRGMMIGEGTAYFNRSRYVRIEMKNEKEIKYLHELFTMLGFDCKPSLRTERQNMWSLYMGAKQLAKYHREIGFGVHKKRQEILEKGVNKKLRVNQYC